ncbi:MAG: methyltransferase [Streptosporangiales bacterium]|nr:methyltransferase [Streptosporangiales bacterium]
MTERTGGEHYFSASPSSDPGDRTVRFTVDGHDYALRTARGVFSSTRLDPGTAVLLQRGPAPPATGTLLDLGCGYGPIACVLARRSPGAEVWAVDVNERARELTRTNAAALGLPNVRVASGDEVPADVMFDAIYANPPIRVGKSALHDLLRTWLGRLRAAGSAHLVVQRNLGADSLQRWLTDQRHACERLASAKGFRILRVGPATSGQTDQHDADDYDRGDDT